MFTDPDFIKIYTPLCKQLNVRLVYYQWSAKTLQVFIEREDFTSVTVDDCAKLSKILSPFLDMMIENAYTLEISSVGLERPLRTLEDFIRFNGKDVKIKLYEDVHGLKQIIGMLINTKEQEKIITIQWMVGKKKYVEDISYHNVQKAQLIFKN